MSEELGRLKVCVVESEYTTVADFEGGTSGATLPDDLALPPYPVWKVWCSQLSDVATYSANAHSGDLSGELPATNYGATIGTSFSASEALEVGAHIKVMPGATDQTWAQIWLTLGDNAIEIIPTQAARSTPTWDTRFGFHPSMVVFEYTNVVDDEDEWALPAAAESDWLGKWMDIRFRRTGEWSITVGGSVILSGNLNVPADLVGDDDFGISVSPLGDGIVLVDDVYILPDPWKYASPYPGENGGFGKLKVKVFETGDPAVDWVLAGW